MLGRIPDLHFNPLLILLGADVGQVHTPAPNRASAMAAAAVLLKDSWAVCCRGGSGRSRSGGRPGCASRPRRARCHHGALLRSVGYGRRSIVAALRFVLAPTPRERQPHYRCRNKTRPHPGRLSPANVWSSSPFYRLLL